ncbi:MAG: T9SS type A sorting domain-containing protein [Bacteroidota bacterium]
MPIRHLIGWMLGVLTGASPIFAQYLPEASFGAGGYWVGGADTVTLAVDAVGAGADSLLVLAETGPVSATEIDRDVLVMKWAADGTPDTDFGTAGELRFDFDSMAYSTAIALFADADGSFLVLGSGRTENNASQTWGCLERISRRGERRDLVLGKKSLHFAWIGLAEYPNVIQRDAAGRYLIAGSSFDPNGNHPQPVIMRLTPDFRVDTTFGETGILLFDFGAIQSLRETGEVHFSGGFVRDLIVLTDGTIAFCGGLSNGDHYVGFIAGVRPDGTLNPDFCPPLGYRALDLLGEYDTRIRAVRVLPDGTLVFGATTSSANPVRNLIAGRLNPQNGSLTHESIDLGVETELERLEYLADGSLALLGTTVGQGNSHLVLTQIPDPSRLEIHHSEAFSPNPDRSVTGTFLREHGSRLLFGGYTETPTLRIEAVVAVASPAPTAATPASAEQHWTVYPNPTAGTLHWQSALPFAAPTQYEVRDLSGRLVRQGSLSLGKAQIDLHGLPAALYLLRLSDGKYFSTVRVQKLAGD